jgi:hypothetical protein
MDAKRRRQVQDDVRADRRCDVVVARAVFGMVSMSPTPRNHPVTPDDGTR